MKSIDEIATLIVSELSLFKEIKESIFRARISPDFWLEFTSIMADLSEKNVLTKEELSIFCNYILERNGQK